MLPTSSIRHIESINLNKEISLVDERENSDGAFKSTPTKEKEEDKAVKPNPSSSKIKEQVPYNILR